MNIGSIIHNRRIQLGLTLEEVGTFVGVGKSTVKKWESGFIENMKRDKIALLAQILQLDPITFITGEVRNSDEPSGAHGFPHPKVTDAVVTFPVIGEMAAGYEHIAAEDWSGDTIEVPKAYLHGRSMSDFIVLTVCGDSMYPAFMEGDKVLVLLTPELEYSGQVGLVRYDGELATLKKVEYPETREWLRLVPINPSYPSRTISDEALADCSIIGIPRLIIRTVD